ncbi:PAS domain S-box protein [Leptospira kanakyensis]|uniref:histidine kinase n=1 Tax=Leptospira kanakyensis TaxID=2484968 RepID=A0A6N4Q9X4_9LEPT|nr:histidine kinase dimerization/phosphoacceptor domain -containing protein [Leptospira kanakyensis]TGK55345.1 PAS domain S-box protein [Leptospira kanakyensis]TGK60879.1 PAS domain S-box protein [Leptospira kanakyensis]TGK76646.1 PAS domain S-box protein [Leptospira kanakyensis]
MKLRNRNLDPERIADFECFRSGILELIVGNSPLTEVLNEIVIGIETLNPTMICTVVLVENSKIKMGAAPSLPKIYNDAIEGVTIGPEVGSCGTAAYTGKRVIVEDISKSPLWKNFKNIALSVGLFSCWSEPIRSHKKEVIGTFAIYHKEILSPSEFDIFIITETADLVSIAIEKSIVSERLTESEGRFRNFFEKNSSVMLIIEPNSGEIINANQAAVAYYGYPHEVLTKMKIDEINTLPSEQVKEERMRALSEERSYFSFPHKLANGITKQVEVYSTPIETNNRHLLFSIVHDVTERKTAEEKVKSLLSEKELILREVHHRIKNNMTILYNLLDLQAGSQTNVDVQNSLKDATSRIKTMSLLYDKLYSGKGFSESALDEYLIPLSEQVISLFPYPVKLNTEITKQQLSAEQLQAIGIITNELLTNSLKYAREPNKDLIITIKTWREGQNFQILISDNGKGFDPKMSNPENLGFGLTLVTMLLQQIQGTLSFQGNKGAEYQIKFPISKPHL